MARFFPSLSEFREAAQRGNLVPIYREMVADGDTPVSAYAKLGRSPYSFLLESVVGGAKWGSYSFIGVGARAVYRAKGDKYEILRFYPDSTPHGQPERHEAHLPKGDPTAALGALLATFRPVPNPALPRFSGGAVGWLSYDVVRAFERLPSRTHSDLDLPEACFVISDTLIIFDNLRQTLKVVAHAFTDGEDVDASYAAACARIDRVVETLGRPAPPMHRIELSPPGSLEPLLSSNMTREQFMESVRRAKEYILAGDVFQVVLSQRFTAPRGGADPFEVYRALRVVNPSPYMFHLNFPEAQVTGASPEVLVRVDGRRIEVRPIAGTRRRGANEAEDARLEAELLLDPKERAEHVMLIDLGRNDVGRVASIGSVRVHEQMSVEHYSHVMHLVSGVSGELAEGRTALDGLRACFPAGTLSGAPKIRAMEIIEELEPTRRAIYGGAVGYLSFSGNLDFAIAIRTLVTQGDTVYLQAGAGIVADSDPATEYEETVSKARAVIHALAMARAAEENR